MRLKTLLIIAVLLSMALLGLTYSGAISFSETAAPAAERNQESTGAVVIPVEVGEWYVELPQTTFKVGVPYRFVVTNKGMVTHELMIMPPVEPSSQMSMEELDKMALAMIEEEDLGPGATASVEVTFEQPGQLEASCRLPGHYEAGMKQLLTVEAK